MEPEVTCHRRHIDSGEQVLPSSPENPVRRIVSIPSQGSSINRHGEKPQSHSIHYPPPKAGGSYVKSIHFIPASLIQSMPFYGHSIDEEPPTTQTSRNLHKRYSHTLDPQVAAQLQTDHSPEYKASILTNLHSVMEGLIKNKIKSLSKEHAQLQLKETRPGTYIIRASTTKPGHIALCTHIISDLFHHEVLGPPEAAAERLYERMAIPKNRIFEEGERRIDVPFCFYVPFTADYILKTRRSEEELSIHLSALAIHTP